MKRFQVYLPGQGSIIPIRVPNGQRIRIVSVTGEFTAGAGLPTDGLQIGVAFEPQAAAERVWFVTEAAPDAIGEFCYAVGMSPRVPLQTVVLPATGAVSYDQVAVLQAALPDVWLERDFTLTLSGENTLTVTDGRTTVLYEVLEP